MNDLTSETPTPTDGERTLAADVVRLLAERGLTMAVAESSTGGLIGHLITDVPGSSAVFLGGYIAYSDRLKEQMGVPRSLLESEGAVSVAVAESMARAVCRQTRADVGIAVTGIAGPGGATESKPVGLTFLALADARTVLSERHTWRGDRSHTKSASAQAALEMLKRFAETKG
jgi:PncC family amidohydrolase